MAPKLERYVRQHGHSLHYQRDYPMDVRHLCGKKTFTYPLGKADQKSGDIRREISKAEEAFNLACRRIRNSDPSAFNASDLDIAATQLLRSRRLRPGQFINVPIDPLLAEEERRLSRQLQMHPQDYAAAVIPEIDDAATDYLEQGGQLSFDQRVVKHAYDKLIDRAKARPQTLSALWREYVDEREIDLESRDGKRIQRRWDAWLACAGEIIVSPSAIDQIHDGLDRYVAERKANDRKVKGQSISRELREVVACLRRASKAHRLGWVIEPPHIGQNVTDTKEVLSQEEQRRLVRHCMSVSTPSEKQSAALVLMLLQCGGMPSEIKRLTSDRIALDAPIPHFVILGKTKSTARPRIVPIVLGKEVIRESINDLLQWLNSTVEETHSRAIKVCMKKALGTDKYTGHCLRHSFRVNAAANGADAIATATIAGWSGKMIGMSGVMLKYGAEGLSQSDSLKGLQRESLKIHRHLLSDSGQVIQFPARA